MINTLLRKSLPLVLAFTALNTEAQITIDQADFPVSQNQHRTTYVHELNEANYTTPSEGPNQIWDYQGLTNNGLADYPWSASTAPFFSDGYHFEAGYFAFSAFTIRADFYTGFDGNGYFRYGKQQYDTTFSLTAVTGGANDELHFLDDQQLYSGISDDVIFPMTYGDQWADTYSRTTPFEITVAGFGLSNTPGIHKRIFVMDREVVGHGKLLMSHLTTTISDSMDVLLVKNNYQTIDSFFVAGMPAPPALLAGMGVTQGEVTNNYHSFFYRQGYGDLLIQFDGASSAPGSAVNNIYYNENSVVPSTAGLNENTISNSEMYPNPAQAGTELFIDLNQSSAEVREISIVSLSGQEIHRLNFNSINSETISLEIPSSLNAGHYFIQGKDIHGFNLFREKLVILD
ncbi:MAG: hypothetical protein ACJA1C_001236 [Crocinitomicaceae bacterium]|jgi:hypothetical protein